MTAVQKLGRPVGDSRPFIGRGREAALIADACVSAREGRGRLIVVRGDAGLGKTTLCEHVAAGAVEEGFAVGWGRCWSDGGAPPLWPWSTVLDALGGVEGADLLTDDSGHRGLDPERFARFVAVGQALADRATSAPLMIVIDDAHAADIAALLLARFVVRALDRCPVVTLLARRPRPANTAAAALLDDLEREALVLPLRPFDTREAAAFMSAHGLHVEEYGLVPALVRITQGNPLLLARAATHSSPHALAGVENVIGDAIAGLPPTDRRVVAMAAVLGVEATASEIARIAAEDLSGVLSSLSVASAAGLVDATPTGYAFTHDLVRAAAVAALGPKDRLDAHAVAVTLASSDDRPAAVTRRAHHALAAAARSDDDARRAVDMCVAAARVLTAGFDYERAAELLDAAHELAERLSPPGDHVHVLLEWADALLACGRLADARGAFSRAADAAERAGDPEASARAALGMGGVWLNEHRGEADRRRVLAMQRVALASLPPGEDALAARLAVRLAAEAVYDGAPVAPVLDALEAARNLDDQRVLAEALSLTHHAMLAPEHLHARLPLAGELVQVASAAGDGLRVVFGLLWKSVDLFHQGDHRAERVLGELRERADAVGCRSIAYVVAAIDVMRLIRSGRLDDAEKAADDCFRLGVEVGDADAAGYYGAHLLTIRLLQGREQELSTSAREIADSPTLVGPEFAFRAVAANLAARAGRRDEAIAALDDLAAGGLAALPRSSSWLVGIVVIVDTARRLGDRAVAAEGYALLLPFADRPIMPSLAVSCLGSVEWALGLAAEAMGDVDAAVAHLERAVEANHRLGHRPMTMVVAADLARALATRGVPGDLGRAVEGFEQAATIADEIGLAERASRWRQQAVDVHDAGSRPDDALLHRDGKRWVIDAGGRRAVAPDLVGLRYLGTLLTRPGEEVSAVALCGGATVEAAGQDLIDRSALDSYRLRVREIDEALRDATDRRRVRRLRDEREALRAELSSALTLSGRTRRFVDSAERARTAVRKAIARAIDTIAEADGELGAELRATISTGRTCIYLPDPARPRRWSVRAERETERGIGT